MAVCPHCGAQVIHAGAVLGGRLTCAGCGGVFVAVAPPPVPPPIQSLPQARQAAIPVAPRQRHWAKILMLAATITWPVCGGLWATTAYVNAGIGYIEAAPDHFMTHEAFYSGSSVSFSRSEIRMMQVLAAVTALFISTVAYVVSIAVLFVLWFATKD